MTTRIINRQGTVFDASHRFLRASPATTVGPEALFGAFRRTDRDRAAVAREILTARLMGDPAPDRVVPELPPEKIDRRFLRDDEPMSPIYLTFREMRAAYGDPEPTP